MKTETTISRYTDVAKALIAKAEEIRIASDTAPKMDRKHMLDTVYYLQYHSNLLFDPRTAAHVESAEDLNALNEEVQDMILDLVLIHSTPKAAAWYFQTANLYAN